MVVSLSKDVTAETEVVFHSETFALEGTAVEDGMEIVKAENRRVELISTLAYATCMCVFATTSVCDLYYVCG